MNPASIDYYVAGLRSVGPVQGGAPETPWKAVALVSLFVSAMALVVSLVAVLMVSSF
jgi:hypothetical protein